MVDVNTILGDTIKRMKKNLQSALNDFRTNGFCIYKPDNMMPIEKIRTFIANHIDHSVDESSGNRYIEKVLDDFHKHNSMEGEELNNYTINLIEQMNKRFKCNQLIFESCKDFLITMFGEDIAAQKYCNLALQKPKSDNKTNIHRDAPVNSFFEIVVYIPLCSHYKSKTLYLINVKQSEEAVKMLENKEFINFEQFVQENGVKTAIEFGDILFFWTGLFHGVNANETEQTRFALNIRYKNLFSPYGTKDFGNFFEILQLSAITDLAIKSYKGKKVGFLGNIL